MDDTRLIGVVLLGAAALLLLGVAALMTKSVLNATSSDVGVETDGIMTTRVGLTNGTYMEKEEQIRFWESLVGRIQAQPGVALVAQRAGVPILPVGITGSQHMSMPFMFFKPFRLWRITVTIGKPFILPKPERLNAEAAQEGTRVIMDRIAALLPEEYRGYYGSTPVGAAPPEGAASATPPQAGSQ